MATTLTKSQITWLTARFGASLVTNEMPIPESAKTIGKIAGSASGARKRVAMWAMTKAANSPRGTPSVVSPSCSPLLRASMANSNMTMGAAMHSSTSSKLRLVIDFDLRCSNRFSQTRWQPSSPRHRPARRHRRPSYREPHRNRQRKTSRRKRPALRCLTPVSIRRDSSR